MVNELGTALLSIQRINQTQSVYSSDTITMRLGRHIPSELGGMELRGNVKEGRVIFPPAKVLFQSQETKMQSVDTQVSCYW